MSIWTLTGIYILGIILTATIVLITDFIDRIITCRKTGDKFDWNTWKGFPEDLYMPLILGWYVLIWVMIIFLLFEVVVFVFGSIVKNFKLKSFRNKITNWLTGHGFSE